MLVAHPIVISMTNCGAQQKPITQEDMQEKQIGDIAKKKNVPLRKMIHNEINIEYNSY